LGGILVCSGVVLCGTLGKFLDDEKGIKPEWNYELKKKELKIY
jgi:hypothetical protein